MTIVVVMNGRYLELANLPDTLGGVVGVQEDGTAIRVHFSSNTTLVYENGFVRYEPTVNQAPPSDMKVTPASPPPTSSPPEQPSDVLVPEGPPSNEPYRGYQDMILEPQEEEPERRYQDMILEPQTPPENQTDMLPASKVRKRTPRGGKADA